MDGGGETLVEALTILEAIIVLAVVGALSYRFKLLTVSGVISSFMLGLPVIIFGGWEWLAIVLVFFILAMFFTKFKYGYKTEKVGPANSGIRAWRNVFANGSVAALFALAEGFTSFDVFLAGFVGAMGTATADTLATEVGLLYPRNPRLITNLKQSVRPGTSGAISPLGEIAMIFGSFAIGLTTWMLRLGNWSFTKIMLVVISSSIIGSTLDSLLGATTQATYECSNCGKTVEGKMHCGKPSRYVRGVRAIDNNAINFIGTLIGAIMAMLFARFL